MTDTQAPQITTRPAKRYDDSPATEILVDGKTIGHVYKTSQRTPQYAGRTRICSGYIERTVWAAEARGWRLSGRTYRVDLDRTKKAAVAHLVDAYRYAD